MNSSTLRGVFPEPAPVHRRNFIKENVKRIREMQGLSTPPQIEQALNKRRLNREREQPTVNKTGSGTLTQTNMKLPPQKPRSLSHNVKNASTNNRLPLEPAPIRRDDISKMHIEKFKYTSRAMQTERGDDLLKIYETGVIKYATKTSPKKFRSPPRPQMQDHGDTNSKSDDLYQSVETLDISERNYVKDNIKNLKTKQPPKEPKNKGEAPAGYKMGEVPKYLKERKGERLGDQIEPECPPGHILLPEDERKETLRVLRQSYADRVQELNSLPVRSDTLKMKKRKMEIEEELKKIDEGIKVFQRPKVFVKINA